MEEQIIKSLLATYREKGVDLTNIVSNPIFMHLPLETKVRMLRQNADEILAGSRAGISKTDIVQALKRAGTVAGISGAIAGFGAAEAVGFSPNSLPIKTILRTAGIAAAASAGLSGLNMYMNKGIHDHRKSNFERLASNPTDDNALRVLFSNSIAHTPSRLSNPIDNIVRNTTDRASDYALKGSAHIGRLAGYETLRSNFPDSLSVDDIYLDRNEETGEENVLLTPNAAARKSEIDSKYNFAVNKHNQYFNN